MFSQVILVGLVAAAAAAPTGPETQYSAPINQYAAPTQTYKEPIPYNFQYGVQDEYAGTQFSQSETSDGQQVTGYYQVALPDGRIQKVTYVADHYGGYRAEVSYTGEAQYPKEYGPAVTFRPQIGYGQPQQGYAFIKDHYSLHRTPVREGVIPAIRQDKQTNKHSTMIAKVSLLTLLLVQVIAALPTDLGAQQKSYDQDGMPYNFAYGVRDDYAGTDFGQQENSDGNTVKGTYTVQLPDGRKQTVNYEADHYKGFVADVQYYGEAQYPHEYGPAVTFKPQGYGQSAPVYQPQTGYN
ncbi:uncharacterized protein LOC126981628 [Eriocheir sinensis]|uniref:uncharacterized protein LOC126981628 n=1 Tax=Eriocheir sinensis TaxID=95602 RepID=UPI0021C799DE|nr:uncharacterized protein LOC126981628 [Eriocheir sinensis]